jgi:hypothetical protein
MNTRRYLDIVIEDETAVDFLKLVVVTTPPESLGDYNNDGIVDGRDYVIWRKNVGASQPAPSAMPTAMASLKMRNGNRGEKTTAEPSEAQAPAQQLEADTANQPPFPNHRHLRFSL